MTKLNVVPLASIASSRDEASGGWICEQRLPEGTTLITGIAGSPCSKKTLEGVASSLFAAYCDEATVAGAPAREGSALYVQIGGDEARLRRHLAAAFEEEPPETALAAVWPGKMSTDLAQAIREAAVRAECRLVVVNGAHAGCEGRQKLSTVLAELDRAARDAECAVAVLLALSKRNALCVKDPTTGIWDAVAAVWEVYGDAEAPEKCFCTAKGSASAFALARHSRSAPPRSQPRPAPGDPPQDEAGEEGFPEGEEGDGATAYVGEATL